MIKLSDTIWVEAHELQERFVRASGPGGQNVNKVATAVELRFDVTNSSLPSETKARLIEQLGNRISGDGVLIIDSREHRTQGQKPDRRASAPRRATVERRQTTHPASSDEARAGCRRTTTRWQTPTG